MSQENDRPNSAAEGLLPVKRKRGRPRKDTNQFQDDTPVLSPGSDGVKRNQRQKIDPVHSSSANTALVGQIVNGVLDGSFDAGYFLTVKVGNTDTVLRGVVFEPGSSVPISSENDVAPQVKMFHRIETPLPVNDPPNLGASLAPSVLQSGRKSQHVKVVTKNETAKGSSEIKTNPRAENVQRKDIPIRAKGSSNSANNVPSDSSIAVLAKSNIEQKTEISSRNKNTHRQKGLPEDVKKLSILASEAAHCETEIPTELPESEKSGTVLAVVAKETQVSSQSTNS